MRTTARILFKHSVLAILTLWSGQALSMMGNEGPAPCESQACFIEAVSACKVGTSYVTRSAAGALVQYAIESPTENDGCRLGMIYMQHPESDWTYKPLYFVLDRNGEIDTQLKKSVADCLSGDAVRNQECSGPLIDMPGARVN